MKYLFVLLFAMLAFTVSASDTIILTKENSVTLRGEVKTLSIGKLMKDIADIHLQLPLDLPIYLVLDTPGGSIAAGESLISFIKSLDRNVHTITDFSASMGFQIVQNLNNRYILPHGTLMSHPASLSFGSYRASPEQFQSMLKNIISDILKMDINTVNRTQGKQSLLSYKNAYKDDMWITGLEAVTHGYADEVIAVRCDSELMKNTHLETIKNMFGEFNIEMSDCPIMKYPIKVIPKLRTNKGLMELDEFLNKGGLFGSFNEKPELYMINPNITLEDIQEEMRKIQENGLVNRKNVIRMVWGAEND